MTPSNRRRRLAAAAALCALATATSCSGGDGKASEPATTPDTASTTTEPATTIPVTMTSTPATSTSTTELNPVPTLNPSTTSSSKVERPPVSTLVPEVSPDLLRPEQIDPANVTNNRPILPEHLPILEAYLNAIQAATLVSSTWPINPEAPELVGSGLVTEMLARVQAALRNDLEMGNVLDVSQGVTFRPYVVGPVTDTAVVLDCELAGHYWKKVDTGELLPPDEVWPAGPGRIVEVGLYVEMVLRDGQWLVANSAVDPGSCG